MKSESILFIAYSGPCPPRDGKRQRTYALLQALSTRYQVDFLIIDHKEDFEAAVNCEAFSQVRFLKGTTPQTSWSRWMHRIGLLFLPSRNLRQQIRELISQKDYAFIFSRYLQPVAQLEGDKPILLDLDDDFLEVYQTRISTAEIWKMRWRLRQILVINLPKYRRLIQKVKLIFTVKPEISLPKAVVLPNLPFQLLQRKRPEFTSHTNKRLLYVGKLSYSPNSRGISWFIQKVLPGILRTDPEVELVVVSKNPPQDPELADLICCSTRVQLHLNVSDLEYYYQNCALVIAPVFEGGGSNIKISEALWMGRPVVTTPFGGKGFDFFSEKQTVIVANSPDEFSKLVLNQLSNPELLTKLHKVTYDAAQEEFNLDTWSEDFLNAISNV